MIEVLSNILALVLIALFAIGAALLTLRVLNSGFTDGPASRLNHDAASRLNGGAACVCPADSR